MSQNLRNIFLALLVTISTTEVSFADHGSEHATIAPDISGWGFEIGLGSQPYMENVSRVSLITPVLFNGWHGSHLRLTGDLGLKTLQAFNTDPILEYALSLESNSKVYKDVVYTFVKLGFGAMQPDDYLYEKTIFIVPISLGLQTIFQSTEKAVSSIFVEYRYTIYNNYKSSESLPKLAGADLDDSALFSGTTSIGVRVLY